MEKVLNTYGKDFLEMVKLERLNDRVTRIINMLFEDEELEKANLYKHIIISYIKENIKPESLMDDITLTSIIKVYFEVLTTNNPSIDKFLYLQTQSKTINNSISREIEKKYLDSKFTLLSLSYLFDIRLDEYENTDMVIDEIMMRYEDRNVRGRIYCNVFQQYKNDQEKSIMITKKLAELDKAYNTLTIIKASNRFEPYREQLRKLK